MMNALSVAGMTLKEKSLDTLITSVLLMIQAQGVHWQEPQQKGFELMTVQVGGVLVISTPGTGLTLDHKY